jgi:hypothetical protein
MMTITTIIDMIMIDTTMIEMIADLGGRLNIAPPYDRRSAVSRVLAANF